MRRFSLNEFMMLCVCSLIVTGALIVTTAEAQRRSSGNAPSAIRTSELKKLDQEAGKVETEFLKNAYDLSAKYEKAGDLERAIEYLEAMLKINPDLEGLEERIDELKEDIISANDFEFRMEIQQSWGDPVAFVRAGKPFMLKSAGSYKLTLSETVTPEGFPEGNIQTDLLEDIPVGKLVGLIVPRQGARNNGRNNEETKLKPIEFGPQKEVTPKETGFLYLKVNTPATARVSGVLNIQLSGYVLAPDGRNIGKK